MTRQSSNKEDKFEGKEEKSRHDTRRPRSEGSAYQRADGRWVARVPLEGGGRKLIYRKTEKEALSALRKALNEQEQGTREPLTHLWFLNHPNAQSVARQVP